VKSVLVCRISQPKTCRDIRARRLIFVATSCLLTSGRRCQPCKKEMPGYQKLVDEYGSRGFVVVGFKFDTMPDMEDPVEFAKGIGVRYPLAVGTDDVKQKFGGIEGLPTTMLYDRHGILRTKVVGFEYTENIESGLKPLL